MTSTLTTPVPVTDWDAADEAWLAARNDGISASDVAAVLGFSEYSTPWEVWAEKVGLHPRDAVDNEAIRLGIELEPWLLDRAGRMLGIPVGRTPARLYAHPSDPWQLASPDGEAHPANASPFGIEAKTAGLASGYGIPDGWSEARVPLGYEFQARWQMRIMGWDRVDIVGLVAGVGVRLWPIERDDAVETDMVMQVTEWRQTHIIQRVEPPVVARDNALMAQIWPTPTEGVVDLTDDPDIDELLYEHRERKDRARDAKAAKDQVAAAIKRKLGPHEIAVANNRVIATWSPDVNGVRRLNVKGM